jgi:D-glycero-D-manno-heptose 1,7-bisphosphate phosphatase
MGINSLTPRAVFLDRDGVINHAVVRDGKPYPPATLAEFNVVAEAYVGLRQLQDAGFLLIVVTNQPDVARGTQAREVVESFHGLLASQLPITAFYTCYHDDADQCLCRKPAPGLLLEAAAQLGVDLSSSFLIGDRWKDIEAGLQAGVTTVFLDFKYAEQERSQPHYRVNSLQEATNLILTLNKD